MTTFATTEGTLIPGTSQSPTGTDLALGELDGTRVFVVEDEAILSVALQDMLADLGCHVVGAAARLKGALKLDRELAFDVAVLDVNLGGEPVDQLAHSLARRGVPFILTTGYGDGGDLPLHTGAPVVEKPYDIAGLRAALLRALPRRSRP